MSVEEPPHAKLMRSAIRAASDVLRLLNLSRNEESISGSNCPNSSILCRNGCEALIIQVHIHDNYAVLHLLKKIER